MRVDVDFSHDRYHVFTRYSLIDDDGFGYSKCFIELTQTFDSYRDCAISMFCFHGKKINCIPSHVGAFSGAFSVEADEIDKKFLELAEKIPAVKWKTWEQIYNMIINGSSREEVLKYMLSIIIVLSICSKK
jgi:hypothetical protein